MRKTLATIALALGLAVTAAPAVADTAPPAPTDPCTTGGTVTYVDATPIVDLTQQVDALEGRNNALVFELHGAAWRLHRRHHRIERQAREIRHLRAELRAERAKG